MIISLFETVRLSVSISPRNLYNPLKSIKENIIMRHTPDLRCECSMFSMSDFLIRWPIFLALLTLQLMHFGDLTTFDFLAASDECHVAA